MCAICGILNFAPDEPVDPQVIERMTSTLAHRGPDGDGFLFEGPVGFGFRRLSIIDLKGGHQPIQNEDGTASIIFNGEIYNYRQLATSLVSNGHVFKTRSDTETILHSYEQYGEGCVDELRGMFAFAIWDRNRRSTLLARDRLGIKPLYYYTNGRFLAFASEIKALLQVPGVPAEVDPEALDSYLTLRYVPGPRTMFRDVFSLPPGHILVADPAGIRIRKYWDVAYSEQSVSELQAVKEFRRLLEESISLRMISEVPLGVALSGGLDSSAILALLHKNRRARGDSGRIKTFSVGYEATSSEEKAASEFEYAHLAADAFNTEHHEYRLNAKRFEEYLPDLVWHLDQPLADPRCVPLHFISKLAREHVTVILSGEGADEILGGYAIYSRMLAFEKVNQRIPQLKRVSPWLKRITPSERLRAYLSMSGLPLDERYRGVSRGFGSEALNHLIGAPRATAAKGSVSALFQERFHAVAEASPLNRMLYADAKAWLPDDLLLKADKMTMGNSIELRVPFLDHQLVEFCATLPDRFKIGPKGRKALLRNAMRGILPDQIIDRPKKGFPVPLASWLRKPLRQFTRDHLLASHSACREWLDQSTLSRLVTEHEDGRTDRSQELWTLLVFELWHGEFVTNSLRTNRAA